MIFFLLALAVRAVGDNTPPPAPTVNGALSVLLLSLLSAILLTSSAFAKIVCEPAVAVHVEEPLAPHSP